MTDVSKTAPNPDWWRGALIYQIYPRSYQDSNHDGIGDLPGITARLEYIASLGVDAVWLSPIFTSPMKDFGYDVADYTDVDPMFGSLDDFRAMLDKAHGLGLKVMIDQVISHSSDQHPWFAESRQSRDNAKADWYVWADAKADGSPPNNWLSLFGGSAWAWDSRRRQYYLHNFLASQPDLNLHNPEVQAALLGAIRFWLALGVDGFRLDTVNFYFHDPLLRDNPPLPADQPKSLGVKDDNPYSFQRHLYDISRPENLVFLQQLRTLLDEFPDRTMVGEIGDDFPLQRMAEYTSGGDKLHMAYTFDLLNQPHDPTYIRTVIRRLEDAVGDGWPCWALSNHDVVRCVSRWNDDPQQSRQQREDFAVAAMAMLISMRGSVCIYQGEELALPEAEVPFERLQDPYALPFWPQYKGRDGCRTPMVWRNAVQGEFSTVEPWLPVDERHLPLAVAEQEALTGSVLQRMRQLLRWRQQQPALIKGSIEVLDHTGELLCWIRRCEEQSLLVVINLSDQPHRQPLPCAIRQLLEGHGLRGEIDGDEMVVAPYQGLFASL
ncbi:alpha glucosidase [Pokkaliibacter sp. MBI-7]|uniref:alpha-glucosidase n=1 Tax=Pokkaliibacter sp. MBI-7 TaxID=3040600 RepID=UPI0024467F88|nr:alpha glucosidase [Pokkaliibacter sp. MBI-7]MDH2433734.1 alpha glucosidase [Pokkaliibacter sp. MBI-7]